MKTAKRATPPARLSDIEIEQIADEIREQLKALHRIRYDIGLRLLKVRMAWPASGPKARGWGEFLRRVGLDDSTAVRYMAIARGEVPLKKSETQLARQREAHLLSMLLQLDPAGRARVIRDARSSVNASGGSGEVDRGSWITAKRWADAVGAWDLDAFSNPRSHVSATVRCMLENGGDGLCEDGGPGAWRSHQDEFPRVGIADADTRTWIQPPYSILDRVVAHYGHTRFCALLRFDPSTEWFANLWQRTVIVAIPLGDREMFEPPPGIEPSSNPHAHAFYYSDVRDVTDEIRRLCIVLRRDEARPQLTIVKGQ